MVKESKAERLIAQIKTLSREDIDKVTEALDSLAISTVRDRYNTPIRIGDKVQAFTTSSFRDRNHPLHGNKPIGQVTLIKRKKEKGIYVTWVYFEDINTGIEVWRSPKNIVVIEDELSDSTSTD